MDYRSFDLNFEVNAIVYDEALANELGNVFFEDLKEAEEITLEAWNARPKYKQLLEKSTRLVSPLL
jgi:cardiolipin synthase